MAFPSSPTNGQQANINGITYTYSTSLTAWNVSTSVSNSFVSLSASGNVTSGNVISAGIVSAAGNISGGNLITAAGSFTTVTASTAIGTASGGTGLGGATPFTSGGVVFASSSSALATGSALYFDGTNLGVGTSSPSAKLTVVSTYVSDTTVQTRFSDNTGGRLEFGGNASAGKWINANDSGTATAVPLIFQNGSNVERMRISAAGDVGIGTSSPGAKLDVSGNAIISGTLGIGTSTFATNSKFAVQTSTCKLDFVPEGGASIKLLAGTGGITLSAPSGFFFETGATQQFEARNLQLYSNGTIKATTSISVGDATPSTSGAGITFPATQSASSNANTLDDYEEGTWTPIDSSGSGLTFTGVSAYYTKIGNMVFATFELVYPASSSSALNVIGGLPFTSATGSAMNAFNVSYTSYSPGLMAPIDANATTFTLYDTTSTNAINNTSLLSKLVRGTCIYKVA